jgi:hypothetical protein
LKLLYLQVQESAFTYLGNKQRITEMAIEEYVVSLNLIINDIIVGYEEE